MFFRTVNIVKGEYRGLLKNARSTEYISRNSRHIIAIQSLAVEGIGLVMILKIYVI